MRQPLYSIMLQSLIVNGKWLTNSILCFWEWWMTETNQFWCFRWQPCQTFIENHLKYEWKCVFSVEWMCVCVLNKTPFPFGTVSILYWAEIMSKPCIKVTQYSQQKNSKQNCDVEHGKQMLSSYTKFIRCGCTSDAHDATTKLCREYVSVLCHHIWWNIIFGKENVSNRKTLSFTQCFCQ